MDYQVYSLNRDDSKKEIIGQMHGAPEDKSTHAFAVVFGTWVTAYEKRHTVEYGYEAEARAADHRHPQIEEDKEIEKMATKVRDELGREGEILEKLDNSPTLRKKAHWSPVTPFSTRTLQQQLEDQHELIPQAEQAYRVAFGSSTEVKLESELEFL